MRLKRVAARHSMQSQQLASAERLHCRRRRQAVRVPCPAPPPHLTPPRSLCDRQVLTVSEVGVLFERNLEMWQRRDPDYQVWPFPSRRPLSPAVLPLQLSAPSGRGRGGAAGGGVERELSTFTVSPLASCAAPPPPTALCHAGQGGRVCAALCDQQEQGHRAEDSRVRPAGAGAVEGWLAGAVWRLQEGATAGAAGLQHFPPCTLLLLTTSPLTLRPPPPFSSPQAAGQPAVD